MSQRDQNNKDIPQAETDAIREGEMIDPLNFDEADNDEGEAIMLEKGADVDPVMPAEEAMIHSDTEAAMEASGDEGEMVATEPVKKTKKARPEKKSPALAKKTALHGKKYLTSVAKLDLRRSYSSKEALELVKETSYTAFDGAVEIHCRLRKKKGKDTGERFRLLISLPHGTGKEAKIGVLDEAMIDKIKQQGDTEYEILLASPALMPKVAQIAKILGPKGKMPNPKTGTVTDDPEAAKRAILSGRVELRADADHNIHQMIGRVSWPDTKLMENYQAFLSTIPAHRILGIVFSATMGPGIRVQLK